MPSLKKRIYLFITAFLVIVLLLICALNYMVLGNAISVDTRNMMIYQGKFIEEHNLEQSLAKDTQSKIIATYSAIDDIPLYLKKGFPWAKMQPGKLHERSLHNDEKQRIYAYALKYELQNQRGYLYIVSEYQESIEEEMRYDETIVVANTSLIIIISCAVLFSFTIIFILIYRTLLSPVRALSSWLDTPSKAIPDDKIKYREMIAIAKSYQESNQKQKELIDKEEFFLNTMSHELRTPIAIISSSVELVERLDTSPKVTKVNHRIDYAIKNMNILVKTLLWLSKKDAQPLEYTEIHLSDVIENVIKDNEYLLMGRETKLSIETELDEECIVTDNYGAVYLILVNLLRNALQHSTDGIITIHHHKGVVTISNPVEQQEQSTDNESYGYGLYLVEKICSNRNHLFSLTYKAGSATAIVDLSASITD
ncbi:sensor histidine kinase [Vibrio rotiferianus]|uniref:sensor histidine kinase n=1 Tax=Vibrio rotiferianus TaxID=190895 RepID=UPI0002375A03|nr:HAMP domain-containing sensor histidine kinase [Vibrio rotiferianus]